MAFAIIESYRNLTYTFGNTYHEHQCELRDLGNQQLGFTDANIVEIINHVPVAHRGPVGFYKERLYPKPSTIIFTLFDEVENLIIAEMHVLLDEKRVKWEKCRRGWTYPNLEIRLKITQDPNLRLFAWTGNYQ
jgi:hypothetical protein